MGKISAKDTMNRFIIAGIKTIIAVALQKNIYDVSSSIPSLKSSIKCSRNSAASRERSGKNWITSRNMREVAKTAITVRIWIVLNTSIW
jgi:hypothetical protein